jgi:hypothetical protein
MATFQKFDSFSEALAEKKHNLASDVLKVLLTNSAPSAANTVKADIIEIAAGNGYPSGGLQVSQASSSQTNGLYKLVLNDVTITASGGAIGPFRYVVIYNDTASNDELIGYYDHGSSITLNSGEDYLIDFSASNGAIQLA